MTGRGSMGYGGAIFLLICWLYSVGIAVGQTSPMVHIRNGTLEGSIMMSRKGREFEAFRGIPYAQKPIGELRFEPPKPFGSWTGVRSAKNDSNFCIQRLGEGFIGDEDCLYLNVYRPKIARGCQTKYPVMVFIHGGGFYEGSADSGFYGPEYLLDHDVILVNMNYRLGALGFLSTEDLVAPGNQGLKDQAQAIRWVHENIAAFNGDPNTVTIFGESSGAGSVHLHMISPQVRGLFHRAIMESGDVLSPGALNRPGVGKNQSTTVGQRLGCPTDKSSTLIRCLKTKKANDIVGISCPEQLIPDCPIEAFRPLIEPDHPGAFITGEPAKAVMSGEIANVPLMTGINAQEGAVVAASIYGPSNQQYTKLLDDNFLTYAPLNMGYAGTPEEFKNNVTRRLRKFYLGDKKIDESTRFKVIDMYTDTWFFIGSQTSVKVHLQTLTAPVYYYYFAYEGSSSFSSLFGDPTKSYGTAHADELQYLFPVRRLLFPNSTVSDEDHKMIDVMTSLWVNFAKSGDPTPRRTPLIPAKWTPVRTQTLQYLRIENSRNIRMADNLLADRVNFWASIPYCKLNEGTNCDYPIGGRA